MECEPLNKGFSYKILTYFVHLKMTKDFKIDLGNKKRIDTSLEQKRSISILLGAGFSVPQGYPTGKMVNESMQKFDDFL